MPSKIRVDENKTYSAAEVDALLSAEKVYEVDGHAMWLEAEQNLIEDRRQLFETAKPDIPIEDRPKIEAMLQKSEAKLAELESVSFDDCIFVVYPRIAKALVSAEVWSEVEAGKVEGKFSILPGVSKDGHEVWVYWNYTQWDVMEAWTFAPRTILNNEGLRPWHKGKTEGHPDAPKK